MYAAGRALPLLLLWQLGWPAAAGAPPAAPESAATRSGQSLLTNEPPELVARLRAQKMVLLQEVAARRPIEGSSSWPT